MFNKFILFVNHCRSISFKKAKVGKARVNKISKGAILMWKVQNDSTPTRVVKSLWKVFFSAGAAQLSRRGNRNRDRQELQESGPAGRDNNNILNI